MSSHANGRRTTVLMLSISEIGEFQIQSRSDGQLTVAEMLAAMEMYKHQILNIILKNPRDISSIPGFNPRKVGS
jgi:hypothetical protein